MKFLSLVLSLFIFSEISNAQLVAPAPAPAATPAASKAEPKKASDDELLAPTAPAANPAQAEIHRNKARLLIDQKDWQGALGQIRLATSLDPKNLDGWLVHGTVAMRLESHQEAYDAFKKYLDLNPPTDKAVAVRQRVAELEIRLDKQKVEEDARKQQEAEARAKATGPEAFGFFLGFSPSYKPAITDSSDLESSVKSAFDFGFRLGRIDLGLLIANGDAPQTVTAKEEESGTVLGTYSNGKHLTMQIYVRGGIPIKEPEVGSAGHAFYVPLHLGGFGNSVKYTDKTFGNMGFDLGIGGQYRYYTGSKFVFDLMALYHMGLPFWKLQNNDTDIIGLYNSKGDRIKGDMSGMELRTGICFLF